jgi:hypothetical protein
MSGGASGKSEDQRLARPRLHLQAVPEKARCDRMASMTTKRKNLMERVASLPEELLDEVEDSLNGIVELHDLGGYRATPEELAAIDEAERGGIASH